MIIIFFNVIKNQKKILKKKTTVQILIKSSFWSKLFTDRT